MKKVLLLICCLVIGAAPGFTAGEVSTFHAYVDSDVCARLMLGPLTASRMECSKKTYKDGADPVLVRLKDNTVFSVNKEKMVKDHVGNLVAVTGEAKEKAGTIKLQTVMPDDASSIPKGDPARRLLDVTAFKNPASAQTFEKVRHELAMMPYLTDYDFISFTMVDTAIILTGWTVRDTNRDDAFYRAKGVEGVSQVINNIDILPLGTNDMQIRADARSRLQRTHSTYFWSNGSDIKIVVKNGNIILLGTVRTQEDSDTATIQLNSVSMAFHVFNLLRVQPPTDKKKG